MEKVDYMKEQMEDISRETETLRKNQEEVIEVNTVTEIKNDFDWLISRLNMVKKKISGLKYMSIKMPQAETQREKTDKKTRTEYTRTIGQYQNM